MEAVREELLVLHGTWSGAGTGTGGRIVVWAESSGSDGREGGADTDGARTYPYQAPIKALEELLGHLLSSPGKKNGGGLARIAERVEIRLRIPSTGDGEPVPSPHLTGGAAGEPAGLLPFKVAGFALRPAAAPRALASIQGGRWDYGEGEGSSYVVDDDLAFWGVAARFLLSLLSRQRFIPSMVRTEDGYRARWRLVLSDESDVERLEALIRAMPPAARAGSDEDARTALTEFLEETADSTIREWLSGSRVARELSGRLYEDGAGAAWYRGLTSASPEMGRGEGLVGRRLQELYAGVEEWSSEVEPSRGDALRTCFRLEPPDPGNPSSGWRLRYLLQSTEDPSLMVDAEDVWRGRLGAVSAAEDARQRLLRDLGKASKLCGVIARTLESPAPSHARLTNDEAYSFMRNDAWLLKESGFGVFIPTMERTRPRLRLVLRPRASGREGGIFGLRAVVDFDWKVAVGDAVIDEEEFMELASLKQPLALIRGKWVELEDVESVRRIIEAYRDRGGIPVEEALRLAAEGAEGEGYVEEVEGEGWLGALLRALRSKDSAGVRPPPPGLAASLRPYQLRGYSWLSFMGDVGLGAILADDMGLGKTVQAIAYILGRGRGPSLIICPTSIVGNWRRELERFAPSLRVMVHHGPSRLSGEEFAEEARRHSVVLSTYSLLPRDIDALSRVEWDVVVLDEAQNVKNPWTKQAQTARRLRARHRVALTGTPVENRLSELWSIMDFLNPGYLGSQREFRRNFELPIERYNDRSRARVLHRLVEPFVLRRRKEDRDVIDDLPDKFEAKVYVNLTVEQATLYQGFVDEVMEEIEGSSGMRRRGLVLKAITRLKQLCDHPSLFLSESHPRLEGRSGKLDRLTEMLEEVLEEGGRALVFTQYVEMGRMLRDHVQRRFGRGVSFLHGGVPRRERDEMVASFQREDSDVDVFIVSLRAGGLGLNLTGANYVFHFDRWWNPAVEDQATDRAYRIGQRKDVQVYKFVSSGTLEERIDALLESKRGLADRIIGKGEAWITELSDEELRGLLELRDEGEGAEVSG